MLCLRASLRALSSFAGLILQFGLLTLPVTAIAQVEFADPSTIGMPLAPGATTSIEFTLRNTGDTPVIALLYTPIPLAINVYTLQPTGACGLASGLPGPSQPAQIPIGAGAEIVCRYSVQRRANAHSDQVLGFYLPQAAPARATKLFLLGELTRLHTHQLTVLPATAGQSGRVHLTVRNDGPTAISRLVYAACAPDVQPDQIVEVLSGPCEQIGPRLCAAGALETGFSLDALPVGTVTSCEFRLPTRFPLFPLQLQLYKTGGATLLNTQPSSDRLILGSGPPVAATALPNPALPVVLLLLAGLGAIQLRRRA